MSTESDSKSLAGLAKYVTAIDHVAIAVHNLEESIRFYTESSGFELKERRRTEGKQTAMVSAVLKAGPISVVLLEGTSPTRRSPASSSTSARASSTSPSASRTCPRWRRSSRRPAWSSTPR